MEIIESIEYDDFNIGEYSSYEGLIIKTNKQEIKMGISNFQSCCENWGSIVSEDDFEDFIGSSLLNIYITDEELKSYDFDEYFSGDCIFINIETNKGKLQLVVYNDHNGYYGHNVTIKSTQLEYDDYI